MPSRVTELIAVGIMILGITGGTFLADEELAFVLHTALQDTNTEDSWDDAKETIYNDIDQDGAEIFCVYSGTTVTLEEVNGTFHPRSQDNVQVEHTWASKASWADDSLHFPRSSVPGADLHHLFPVRSGPNQSRSDLRFGTPVSEERELHLKPNGRLDHSGGGLPTGSLRGKNASGLVVFQPPEEHRGNVARAVFYMSIRYWWEIPDEMESVLRQWHEDDPVDAAEIERNGRIEVAQQNRNPFIDDPSLVDRIADF